MYWVKGETSGVNRSATMQSCYFDLIEKEDHTQKIRARIAAVLWSSNAKELIAKFEQATQQRFASGLNVLLLVRLRYHEQYGFSLEVLDIDPSHTLGDMALRRIETIKRLRSEGLLERQRQLSLPSLVRHIAVITSSSAAGYGDFRRHIEENRYGFPFLLHLFPAVMQGERTESSVVSALERIQRTQIPFDCVVIIRGGGAVSDLIAFDGYLISSSIARFPIPVISGIGHERDQSVVDMVAYLSQKTPTAVADFLIHRRKEALEQLEFLKESILRSVKIMLDRQAVLFDRFLFRLPQSVHNATRQEILALQRMKNALVLMLKRFSANGENHLSFSQNRLEVSVRFEQQRKKETLQRTTETFRFLLSSFLMAEKTRLEHFAAVQELLSPQNTLKRGYAIVRLCNSGAILRNTSSLSLGDDLDIRLADTSFGAKVSELRPEIE